MNLLARLREAPKTFPRPPKAAVVAVLVVLGTSVAVFGAGAALQRVYDGRILPHVTYAGIDIGGLDRLAASERIQRAFDDMREQGLIVVVDGVAQTLPLQEISAEVTIDYADLDVSAAVDAALATDTSKTAAGMLQAAWLATLGTSSAPANVTFNQEALQAAIREAFPNAEDAGEATSFLVTFDKNGVADVAISEPVDGTALDFESAFTTLQRDADDLALDALTLSVVVVRQKVSVAEARTLTGAVYDALENAPYTLISTAVDAENPTTWNVDAKRLAEWLVPVAESEGVALSVDAQAMAPFLDEVREAVDVDAENARFAIENNRVVEFAPSANGIALNDSATAKALTDALRMQSNDAIEVAVDVLEPDITTANVNNLGITEALGTGSSTYGGSPANRIANIKHGLAKLNGLLIAPGDTVSLLEQLRPFTVADGYLPELVIKGDEIKPEVGGGLCQIGSTTFRAVMNAGLKVVERRNHSLVVSYYNDLANGNPGTDATIYDPAPDFKFMNDTANYILLTTEMDATEKMLHFTFWGTSDGRKGSYEPPQVLTWSGYGATQYKETDSLAPGVEQCQSPHPGATTTFTYTVAYADGTTYEEEFFSSYRSLPKICLVGKAAVAEEVSTDATDVEESTATPSDEAVPIE